MLIMEGRTALYDGEPVIILEKVSRSMVKVCKKNNPKMILYVNKNALGSALVDRILSWLERLLDYL